MANSVQRKYVMSTDIDAQAGNTIDIASGRIKGLTTQNKYGINPGVTNNNTPQDIWEPGGQKVYLTSAETLEVVSTSTNDIIAGTGATSVRIEGLNNDYETIEEVVLMNGTVAVTTVNSFLRVNEIIVINSGSYGTNEGTITFTSSTTNEVQGQINPNNGRLEASHFTMPGDKTGVIYYLLFTTGKNDESLVSLRYRPFATNTWVTGSQLFLYESAPSFSAISAKIPPKTDLRFEVTECYTATAKVGITYLMALFDNEEFGLETD